MTETVIDKIRRKGAHRPYSTLLTYADSRASVKAKAYRFLANVLGRISTQFDIWSIRFDSAERTARSEWTAARVRKASKMPRPG